MGHRAAKELIHIRGWLTQADEIDRAQTRLTLSIDLPAWRASLESLFDQADHALSVQAGDEES